METAFLEAAFVTSGFGAGLPFGLVLRLSASACSLGFHSRKNAVPLCNWRG